MSLGLDENAELVVLESAITDRQGELTVVGSPGPTSPLDIETIDHGDWLELDSTCIYSEAEGWIAIPSEIDGKPIRAIGRVAFATCRRMTRLTMPDTIVSIGEGAFTDCIALTELAIPNSVTNIGKNLVYWCDTLGAIRVGNGIASIPKGAFFGSGVTNLVLSVGTTNIEEYAFAANASLKSVTIPQSVGRIKGGAFNGCTSLKEVSVPYATVVEDDAFPSGCEVTRYGPRILACSAAKLDDETLSALMRTLDWRTYHSMECVEFFAACPPYAEECDSNEAPIACVHLGISPLEIWSEDGKDYIQPYYRMPSVEFIGIDPSTRTITGRVVPAEGTSIVSMPFKRAFGFHRLYEDNGTMREGNDWGCKIYLGCEGFSVDFSDYMASNGLFRITFPEEVLEEKSPQPAHLFRIKLSDKDGGLW